jgi:hypothetical protein
MGIERLYNCERNGPPASVVLRLGVEKIDWDEVRELLLASCLLTAQ